MADKLSEYAVSLSRGRLHQEDMCDLTFDVDRERLIRSMAFRRLEYKTQVFINHVGDHYRTRLTHSLEVSQVARKIARALNLNEGLTEVIALAHDIGHPPFGHAGEYALNTAAKKYGGFDHNVQAIRTLTMLEESYGNFDGINPSFEVIEGLIKHNGPIATKAPRLFSEIAKKCKISLNSTPSLEAQVASLADDIAYCNHDIDDGIRAGMFKIESICDEIPQVGKFYKKCLKMDYHKPEVILNETIAQLSQYMICDLISNTKKNLKNKDCTKEICVLFSDHVNQLKNDLKKFLFREVYRNYKVNRMTEKAKKVIVALFESFLSNPGCLPTDWQCKNQDIHVSIIDYIAGMTDRYAIEEYKRLTDPEKF